MGQPMLGKQVAVAGFVSWLRKAVNDRVHDDRGVGGLGLEDSAVGGPAG